MNKVLKVAVLTASVAAASSVVAEEYSDLGNYADGFYAGAFLSSNVVELKEPGITVDSEPNSLGVRAGYYVLPYLAFEARYSTGVGEDSTKVNNVSVDVDMEATYNFGAFAKLGYPTKHFEPYLLLGWNKQELEVSGAGSSVSESESDIGFGLGVSAFFNDQIGVNLEVLSIYVDDEGSNESSISQGSLGVVYSF